VTVEHLERKCVATKASSLGAKQLRRRGSLRQSVRAHAERGEEQAAVAVARIMAAS